MTAVLTAGSLRGPAAFFPAPVRNTMYQKQDTLCDRICLKSAALPDFHLEVAIDFRAPAPHGPWTMRGASFIAVHIPSDEPTPAVTDHADLLLERAGALGIVIGDTPETSATAFFVRPDPLQQLDCPSLVRAIGEALATLRARVGAAIEQTDDLARITTPEILSVASRSVDQLLWLVRSHMKPLAVSTNGVQMASLSPNVQTGHPRAPIMSHNSRTIYPHALRQGPDDLRFRGVERQGCRRVGLRPLGQLQLSASTDTGVVERPRRTALRPLPQPPPVPRAFASGSLMAWQVNRVLAYIEEHIETSLRATELAALARLSSGHFSRAFRVSIGQSPHAYVLCRRVEWAKRLMLSEDSPPLAEIALCCGLSDQAHLSRLFRKLVGETPSAWRRKFRALPSVREQPATLQ